MKSEEDKAFDELARRQGMWGGGFPAKRQMAADKLQEQEEDWGALAEKQLASIKRDTRASFEDAVVCATHKVMVVQAIEEDDDIQDYKKPWVGLTDEEIDKTYWRREPFRRPTQLEFARAIEQMLKEKNT